NIFEKITNLCGKIYRGTVATNRETLGEQERIVFAFRVIGDHIRALTFAIGDGILPGNEGRHYVLRRILRRAIIFAKRLGLPRGSFSDLVEVIIGRMSPVFPELQQRRTTILDTIDAEETMFERTLDRGILLLEDICSQSRNGEISGHDAFTLYDTYGFPLDLTQLMGKERGFSVDEEGFRIELEKQRERARRTQKKSQITIAVESSGPRTEFVGYEQFENIETKILQSIKGEDCTYIITEKTPFYAEKGGQVGDRGELIYRGKSVAIVDTIYDRSGNILHKIIQDPGFIGGERVILSIDIGRRKEIQRHHTATHILHGALRKILGQHIKQCGSYVDECGLRFDFNHFSSLGSEAGTAIEKFVNDAVLANLQITAEEIPFEKVPPNCIAHFGEKYGERVRVLSIGDVSMELCGGCHASSTGELGFFKIVKESAIAAGIRRIEGVVGEAVRNYVNRQVAIVTQLERQFSVKNDEILVKVQQLRETKNALERRLHGILEKNNRKLFDEICHRAFCRNNLKIIYGVFEIEAANDLRSLTTVAIKQEKCDVVILGGNLAVGAQIAIACSSSATDQKWSAAHMAQQFAEKLQAKGGGTPSFATVNVPKKITPADLESLAFEKP
ncbi:MAG: alanine--tRNA ligase, partial [Puniceicoccales bacterium]|nr:alanine--tRNA ligase [Puniceicoccales bacterium]